MNPSHLLLFVLLALVAVPTMGWIQGPTFLINQGKDQENPVIPMEDDCRGFYLWGYPMTCGEGHRFNPGSFVCEEGECE